MCTILIRCYWSCRVREGRGDRGRGCRKGGGLVWPRGVKRVVVVVGGGVNGVGGLR